MRISKFAFRHCLICALFATSFMLGLQFSALAQGVDINDTRLLQQPAINKSHIAFIYAGDLWVADLDGKNVRD